MARDLELLRRYAPQQFRIASWSAETYLILILEQKVSTELTTSEVQANIGCEKSGQREKKSQYVSAIGGNT